MNALQGAYRKVVAVSSEFRTSPFMESFLKGFEGHVRVLDNFPPEEELVAELANTHRLGDVLLTDNSAYTRNVLRDTEIPYYLVYSAHDGKTTLVCRYTPNVIHVELAAVSELAGLTVLYRRDLGVSITKACGTL